MILPATPEEAAELDRSVRRRWMGTLGALGLVIAATLAVVFVVDGRNRDAVGVAAADTVATDAVAVDTTPAVPSTVDPGPVVSADAATTETVAPPTAETTPTETTTTETGSVESTVVPDSPDGGAADTTTTVTTAPVTEPTAPETSVADDTVLVDDEPAVGPGPETVQGVGDATIGVAGLFDDEHLVVRFALAGAGLLTLTDGAGTPLPGASVVLDGTGASAGGLVVPDLADAVTLTVATEGVWEITALTADALPVLGPGALVGGDGVAALAVDDVTELVVSLVGPCDDDVIAVEQWSATELIDVANVTETMPVPVLASTEFVAIWGACQWSAAS